MGFASSEARSYFFSRSSMVLVTSFVSACETKMCSCFVSSLFCLSRFACTLFSLSNIFVISVIKETSAAMILESFCLVTSNFFALPMLASASLEAMPAFSQEAFITSVSWIATAEIAWIATIAVSTFFSTSPTMPPTSRLTVASFLSAMPFFTSASFFAEASRRSCSLLSSSMVRAADDSASLLAARRFMARKVFAPPTAAWAPCTPDSRSVIPRLSSSTGRSSAPLMKGASISSSFFTRPSASSTRSAVSLMMPSTTNFCDCSRIVAMVASSLSCNSFKRGFNFSISSLTMPCKRICVSR
mmetsp:Transcript_115413/g.246656  ORF Transcript_115413/g.246656 Transcript_115413/m.246656 type:complete len:301 (+) Transcript_115413:2733-3635(+)